MSESVFVGSDQQLLNALKHMSGFKKMSSTDRSVIAEAISRIVELSREGDDD